MNKIDLVAPEVAEYLTVQAELKQESSSPERQPTGGRIQDLEASAGDSEQWTRDRSTSSTHPLSPTPHSPLPIPAIPTAAALNQGIDSLEKAILKIVQVGKLQAANLDLAINQRQAAALTQAKQSLQQVQETITNQLPLDFWSIDLRSAIQALGQILGEDATESVLDQVFSRFCIGK